MATNPYTEMLMNQGDYNSAFNSAEAEINRQWSEYMSSTAHQRETQDLLAAGLNPVLSSNQGAQWTSVGNASSDASVANTILNNAAALRMSEISAEATKAAAGATAGAMIAAAERSAQATEFAAEKGYSSTLVSARASQRNTSVQAQTQQRGQDVSALTGGVPALIYNAVSHANG